MFVNYSKSWKSCAKKKLLFYLSRHEKGVVGTLRVQFVLIIENFKFIQKIKIKAAKVSKSGNEQNIYF
jgi:hypothetical protein